MHIHTYTYEQVNNYLYPYIVINRMVTSTTLESVQNAVVLGHLLFLPYLPHSQGTHGLLSQKTDFCVLTTSPSTRVRTLSPISGEMSLPNCCRVVRNRFSLLSCLAPQAGGSCWLAREEEEEEEGPLLKPLGGEGAPFKAVGEWLVPFVTVKGIKPKGEK